MCLQAQYLLEKHQLVNRKGLIARKHKASEAGPLSKGIEADSSCGRDDAGGGHLKKREKKKDERAESEGRERRPAGVIRRETDDSPR